MYTFSMLKFLTALLFLSHVEWVFSSGSTDSATMRAIESELRKVKGTSESVATELKKLKDTTTGFQNEFKWLHNEFKGFKKLLTDIELMINKTISTDVQFLRGKITEINDFMQKDGNRTDPLPTEPTRVPSEKKFFKLF